MTQADGINLHGAVRGALIENTYISNTGDDTYAQWGAELKPTNNTWTNNVAYNPGIVRPNWYGNCFATYGLMDVIFKNSVCYEPTLASPLVFADGHVKIDTTMFIFW